MSQKCETPPVEGGASRNLIGVRFRDPLTPSALQAQFLIAAHHIRPEIAALVASLVFGGGTNA